jgi:hypothetical protein
MPRSSHDKDITRQVFIGAVAVLAVLLAVFVWGAYGIYLWVTA